jgi:Peptidase family M28
MENFQAIADANPSPADGHPSRNSGEPGYKASVDYVAQVMKDAGYDVTIQAYKFTYYAHTAPPVFREVSPTPHDYALSTEWNPGQSTGTATADLQPAGGIVIPPTPTPSSSSGCTTVRRSSRRTPTTHNVIAESKGGDKNHVVVVDAHLDAIYGAGMLDNASGSATILDIAQMMRNVNPLNKLRFIWFGGEELGLLGSSYYVNNLSSKELSHIGYDLDADVRPRPTTSSESSIRRRRISSAVPSRARSPTGSARRRRSRGIKRSRTSTRLGSTTSCSHQSEPTPSASTPSEFPPEAC